MGDGNVDAARDRAGGVARGEHEVSALTQEIGAYWRELRRGASMRPLLEHLFGSGPERLDLGQSDTLDMLVQRDGWRMCELAEALRVDASTATRAVARLHDEGLAVRRHSATDGRVVVVDATAAGRRRHAAIALRRREAVSTMLSDFSLDDRRRLATLLGRLVASLDDYAAGIVATGLPETQTETEQARQGATGETEQARQGATGETEQARQGATGETEQARQGATGETEQEPAPVR